MNGASLFRWYLTSNVKAEKYCIALQPAVCMDSCIAFVRAGELITIGAREPLENPITYNTFWRHGWACVFLIKGLVSKDPVVLCRSETRKFGRVVN